MEPYYIVPPTSPSVPVVISVPHCGTEFPEELKGKYTEQALASLDDTDWFVDKLYDFASKMGILMIKARYHRWVIDLNRDPESKPLYNDGRIITALCPTTDFFGNAIYKDRKFEPDEQEVSRRLEKYYWPYYQKITEHVNALKSQFGEVLFYDAHSIRKQVETIRKEPFPDMILGTNDEKSAKPEIIKIALETLSDSKYELTHNTPFKGGHLTRYFGKPSEGQHGLQLERAKIHYMNDAEDQYDEIRAGEMKKVLKKMFEQLIKSLPA